MKRVLVVAVSGVILTAASACLSSPASAHSDHTTRLFRLSCERDYTVDIWQDDRSGEIFYHSMNGPSGDLTLRQGTTDSAMGKQFYTFQNGDYEYRAMRRTRGSTGEGALKVYKNGRSIMDLNCKQLS